VGYSAVAGYADGDLLFGDDRSWVYRLHWKCSI
jgi:hypothetical protein